MSEGRPFASASDVFEATGDASLNNDGAEARADIEEDGTPVLTQYDRCVGTCNSLADDRRLRNDSQCLLFFFQRHSLVVDCLRG